MDRDVPVADLDPVEPVGDSADDTLLADLERRGVVRRGMPKRLPTALLRPGTRPHEGSVVAALLADRRSGG